MLDVSYDDLQISLFEQALELDRRGITPNCGPNPKREASCGEPGSVRSIFAAELIDGEICELWRFGPGVKGLFRNAVYGQKEAARSSQRSEKKACKALGDLLTGRSLHL
jgi:hypothetical protein